MLSVYLPVIEQSVFRSNCYKYVCSISFCVDAGWLSSGHMGAGSNAAIAAAASRAIGATLEVCHLHIVSCTV